MNEKVKLSEKLGFMLYSSSINIVHTFKNMYYLTFLTMVLQIDVAIAGAMLAIGTVWDAINDSLIAVFCANHRFKSGEKVRPYTLYMCVPWAISIVLLFTNLKLNIVMTIIIGLIIYFIFEALYTFLDMPYNTMASLATKDDEGRKSINGFRSLGACLGTGIGSVAILPLVKLFGGLNDHLIINYTDAPALFKTAIVMGIICITGALTHYFTCKERVKPENEEEDNVSVISGYKMLFKCKSWVYNMVLIVLYGITNTIVMQNINYYAAYVIGDSSAATPILAVYLVIAIIISLVGPAIDRKLGRKNALLLAAIVSIVGKIPFIIKPDFLPFIYVNALSIGFGMTMTYIIFNTNRNNITDILEVQNGRRIDTLVSGCDNMIAKLSESLAIEIMSVALAFAGYSEALGVNQTSATLTTIEIMLGLAPALLFAGIAIISRKLDTKQDLKESIERRDNA
ncbi:MAG: MFS transporter [Erysipelotrichaceae bacterium]|nr:MFS transporter [Erysipelotrichaceae bacterium]